MKNIDYLEEKKLNIILSVFIRNLYFFIPTILDALYLSKITPTGIGGIGVITPLLFFINLFQKGISQSIVIKAQQANVGENSEMVNNRIKKLLVINFYFLFIISLLGMIFLPIFVRFLDSYFWKLEHDASIVVNTYALWISPRILFMGGWIYCNSIFKIFFRPQYATIIGFVGVVLNAALNTVFMIFLIDSTYSASKYLAIATCLSSFLTVLFGVYYLCRDYRTFLSINIVHLFDWVRVKNILKSLSAILFESLSSSIVFNIFIIYITHYGSNIITAFSFVQGIVGLSHSWGGAVQYWNQAYISQIITGTENVVKRGKKNYLFKSFLLFMTILVVILGLLVIIYIVINMFVEHDENIRRYVILFLFVDTFIQIGRMFNMGNVVALLFMGRNKYLLYNTLIIKYLFFLLPLYINDKIFGAEFIMIPITLYILDEYIRACINFIGVKNRIRIV